MPDFWAAAGRSERLVVASGIDREFADEPAVLVDDADVSAGNEQRDASADVVPADPDVTETAQVTKRHASRLVHDVVADAEVGCHMGCFGSRLDAGVEGHEWRLAVERAVRSVVVVIGTEGVELDLECGQ